MRAGSHALRSVLAAVGFVASVLATPAGAASSIVTGDYHYHAIGEIDDDGVAVDVQPPRPLTQAIALEGGDIFVRDAIAWMVDRAGGGNFLVLRATGGDWYNRAITQRIGGVASVETVITRTRAAASDPFVLDRVAKADAIFIAGGNQADYIRLWQGTPLQQAINHAVKERRVPIGGTSAGMMVLSQFTFGALAGSVGSLQVLGRPNHPDIALVRDLFTMPVLANIVTDSHLVSRDRLGRLVTFMARTIVDGWVDVQDARAIGVGGRAALLIEDGVARVAGDGAVYLLRPRDHAPVTCDGSAMPFGSVEVHRLDAQVPAFSIDTWATLSEESTPGYELSLAGCRTLVGDDEQIY